MECLPLYSDQSPDGTRCQVLGVVKHLDSSVGSSASSAALLRRAAGCALAQQLTRCAAGCTLGPAARCTWKVRRKACGLSQVLRLITTQTRGLTTYRVKCGNPVVLFLEPDMLRQTCCETCNCRRMTEELCIPSCPERLPLTYHTDGHGVRTILTMI